MARFILDVQDELGIAIILVEHDMGLVMDIADRILVVDFGKPIAEGTPPPSNTTPTWSRRTSAKRWPSIHEEGVRAVLHPPASRRRGGARRPRLMMSPRMKGTTPATTASVKVKSRRIISPATPNA